MASACAPTGGLDIEEDDYLGNTPQRRQWFAADAIDHKLDLTTPNSHPFSCSDFYPSKET